MIDDKEEVIRYLRNVQKYIEHAIKLVDKGAPVASVRAFYTKVRNTLSDTQEHLRSIKKKQRSRE